MCCRSDRCKRTSDPAQEKRWSSYRVPRFSLPSDSVNLIWPTTLVVRLVEISAAVGAVGKVGIARVVRDFQGRWEARKTCFWFSSLPTDRLIPQPGGRRVLVFEKTWIVTQRR